MHGNVCAGRVARLNWPHILVAGTGNGNHKPIEIAPTHGNGAVVAAFETQKTDFRDLARRHRGIRAVCEFRFFAYFVLI